MKLDYFKNRNNFYKGLQAFFKDLNIPVNYLAEESISPETLLTNTYKANNPTHQLIGDIYILGLVDDAAFKDERSIKIKDIKKDYDGVLIFGVTLNNRNNNLTPTRSQLAEITRIFNREYHYTPVVVVFQYQDYIAFANAERFKYSQQWREGEKAGKVTMLKDIDIEKPNAAHVKILSGLVIDRNHINSFSKLYKYWQTVFSLQALNDQFYSDLQSWFYFAIQNIELPCCPDYIDKMENIKNFLVRLLARTMFCWFVKEKGLIKKELLELGDWEGKRYPLTKDIDDESFLHNNSYYRGILQNIFFNALNKKEKSTKKDFKWTSYIHKDFDYKDLCDIPYLNGGIFDKLEEDNTKESIEDSVIRIPNFLFYGIVDTENVEHKGLNTIFKSYKFTLEENTPFEEDIALDPELLGLVFENLLAELDPNLETNTRNSIRRLTGSYYTPRKIIQEMVNESLFLYLSKFIESNNPDLTNYKKLLSELVYHNTLLESGNGFCSAIVHALDKFKVLDPACGSGAFPMGMLHRIVEILKLVDPGNELWLELKLKSVDSAQRKEFKKMLSMHVDDYGRKLGIIRDSIYGIDIQPLAVQITKLRFFISLLIDQHIENGITPMPNIETKILCADSLKDIHATLFISDAVQRLKDARNRYYQPDLESEERVKITNEIVDILDETFPTFASEITGKEVKGQNKALLREWFNHATIAAPFFNMDFFFPELKDAGGFDCVIGNPPYGGTKVSDEIRNALFIESKDPYGAFIARFLSNHDNPTPLKNGGVLAFIVSDTFMTIKSHLPLRRIMMQNYIHKMIRVHPDTFRATVNTAIIICERNEKETIDAQHISQMADLTNISIHDNYEHFIEVLHRTQGIDFNEADTLKTVSNAEYAIYYYPQNIILCNSNIPFFVASPKLFTIMNDGNDPNNKPCFEWKDIASQRIQVRRLVINGKKTDLIKLGSIAENVGGVKTYDNYRFIKTSKKSGSYEEIDQNEIAYELTEKEKTHGIVNSKKKKFVPFDKSGDMISNDGMIINYWKPIEFYIDWSQDAVNFYSENNGLRNKHRYFQTGITYSVTGIYAPTFRISTGYVFGQKGATIFNDSFEMASMLGVLCSRVIRFLIKNFLSHSVDATDSIIAEIPISLDVLSFKPLEEKVNEILNIKKQDEKYNYEVKEQIIIDKMIYEAYGLGVEDIEEVENWYARRYPRLVTAQKQNLRNLGKSDDYLVLYGLKEEVK